MNIIKDDEEFIDVRPLKKTKLLLQEWENIEKKMFDAPFNMTANIWNEEREEERKISNEEHVKSLRLMDHNLLPIPVELQVMFIEAGLVAFHDEIVSKSGKKKIKVGILSTLYDSILITIETDKERGFKVQTEVGHPYFGNKKRSKIDWNLAIESQEPLSISMPSWFYSDQYTTYPCLSSSERENIKQYWNYYSESAYMITPYIMRLIKKFKEELSVSTSVDPSE